MKGLPGRKAVVLFTDDFAVLPGPPQYGMGSTQNRPQPDATPELSLPAASEGRAGADDRTDNLEVFQQLTQLSNQASVVIYGVEAKGLMPISLRADDSDEVARTVSRGALADTVRGNLLSQRSDMILRTQQGLKAGG